MPAAQEEGLPSDPVHDRLATTVNEVHRPTIVDWPMAETAAPGAFKDPRQ
jgi:hypothetical protein